MAIAQATTLEEVTKLEQALRSGIMSSVLNDYATGGEENEAKDNKQQREEQTEMEVDSMLD